jgi:hypothetical protein
MNKITTLNVLKTIKGFKPLLYLDDKVILSKGYSLYIADLNLSNITYLCRLPVSRTFWLLSKVRIFSRILRLGIESGISLDGRFFLVVAKNRIWKIGRDGGSVQIDFIIPKERKALYLTRVSTSVDKFPEVVFGEYFSNPDKLKVKIWKRNATSEPHWNKAYEFLDGEINHVHNIIYINEGNKYIVLTGDFEDAAAIWEFSFDFHTVSKLVGSTQNARACWAIESVNSLIYATDTHLEPNYLCSLNNGYINLINKIEGSSIYYGNKIDGVYFSTTVEPGMSTGNILTDVLCRKPGPGIISDSSKIYYLNGNNNKLHEVFSAKKDWMPMRLGQFGSFMFPSGVGGGNGLIVYGVALKGYDDCCLLLNHV